MIPSTNLHMLYWLQLWLPVLFHCRCFSCFISIFGFCSCSSSFFHLFTLHFFFADELWCDVSRFDSGKTCFINTRWMKMIISMNRPLNKEGGNANNSFRFEKKNTSNEFEEQNRFISCIEYRCDIHVNYMSHIYKFCLWFPFICFTIKISSMWVREGENQKLCDYVCDLCFCLNSSCLNEKKNNEEVQLKLDGLSLLTYTTNWYNIHYWNKNTHNRM